MKPLDPPSFFIEVSKRYLTASEFPGANSEAGFVLTVVLLGLGGRGIFSPSDVLFAMRLPLWRLAFFGISQSWLGYTRFAAGKWRRVQRLGVVAARVALAVFLLRAGDLLVAGPNWDPAQAKSLATLNQMIAGILALACIVTGLAFLVKFIRISRRSSTHTHTAGLAS